MAMTDRSTRLGERRPFPMDAGQRRVRDLRSLRWLGTLLGLLVAGAYDAVQQLDPGSLVVSAARAAPPALKPEDSRMWMTVGEQRFAITLTDNETARALAALLPLTLDMSEHNGNEKFASLPRQLPTNASQPGRIQNGDVMLFGSDTLVVFYSTFSSSYSYTRIGRVDEPARLAQALGGRGVRVVFSR